MCSTESNSKKAKFDPYLYIVQEVKTTYFLKLNEKRPNQDFHR